MAAVPNTEERRMVREICTTQRIREIPIVDLNRAAALLKGADGLFYREIVESIWAPTVIQNPTVVYLQTMTHGGGICLKPLYVISEHSWRNVTTGQPAPMSLQKKMSQMLCHEAGKPERITPDL